MTVTQEWDTGEPGPLPLDPETADPADAGDPAACSHPPSARRMEDGEQMCTACGEVVQDGQVIVPREREGSTDPSHREGTERSRGGLRHITWDPNNPAASRPYTPEEVELELADTLDRIERGAGFWTTQEEKRSAAKMAYELAYARVRFRSTARSADQRHDEALTSPGVMELYEEWQLLELTCRTAKEGLHNLRSKQSGLQSILRSALDASRGGGFR